MERRHFLRALLGVAAATALPSEVWPFRKIFIPPALPVILNPTVELTEYYCLSVALREGAVQAIELEAFAKEIPDLVLKSSVLYDWFKKHEVIEVRSIPRGEHPFVLVPPHALA